MVEMASCDDRWMHESGHEKSLQWRIKGVQVDFPNIFNITERFLVSRVVLNEAANLN